MAEQRRSSLAVVRFTSEHWRPSPPGHSAPAGRGPAALRATATRCKARRGARAHTHGSGGGVWTPTPQHDRPGGGGVSVRLWRGRRPLYPPGEGGARCSVPTGMGNLRQVLCAPCVPGGLGAAGWARSSGGLHAGTTSRALAGVSASGSACAPRLPEPARPSQLSAARALARVPRTSSGSSRATSGREQSVAVGVRRRCRLGADQIAFPRPTRHRASLWYFPNMLQCPCQREQLPAPFTETTALIIAGLQCKHHKITFQ